MARNRAKSGRGNSGRKLRGEDGRVLRDRYGRARYAPAGPTLSTNPYRMRAKARARASYFEAIAHERAMAEMLRQNALLSAPALLGLDVANAD